MIEVRLTQPQWQALKQTLLKRNDVETKCFLLCKALEQDDDVALLVRELVPVPNDAYEQRSSGLVVIKREFVQQLLVRCAKENLSLLDPVPELGGHTYQRGVKACPCFAREDPSLRASYMDSLSLPFGLDFVELYLSNGGLKLRFVIVIDRKATHKQIESRPRVETTR